MATTQTVLSHWIQGREENSRSGRDAGVINSATGEVVTRVPPARGKVVSSRWPEDAETKIDLAFPTAT